MKRFIKKKSVLCALAIVYVLYTFVNQTITMNLQQKEIVKFNQELKKVEDYNQKLRDDIKICKEDEYAERLARERLGLVKDGEDIIMNTK